MGITTLLIVDQHTEVLKWVEKRLSQNEDFDIYITSALIDAEVILHENKPDILLIDPYMPQGLCVESLKSFKEKHPDMIVVVIAAVIDDKDRKKFSELEINFVLEKRLACAKLAKTLNLAVDIKKSKLKKG